jgi:hypothetical protein
MKLKALRMHVNITKTGRHRSLRNNGNRLQPFEDYWTMGGENSHTVPIPGGVIFYDRYRSAVVCAG